MSAPKRGQLRRAKPSLVLPDGSDWVSAGGGLYGPWPPSDDYGQRRKVQRVDRGSGWGNPWLVTPTGWGWLVAHIDDPSTARPFETNGPGTEASVKRTATNASIRYFKDGVDGLLEAERTAFLSPLLDVDVLACWCPIGEPCHADVLCELVGEMTVE